MEADMTQSRRFDPFAIPFLVDEDAEGPIQIVVSANAGHHPLLRIPAGLKLLERHRGRDLVIDLGALGMLDSPVACWLFDVVLTVHPPQLELRAPARTAEQLRQLGLERLAHTRIAVLAAS